MEKSVQFYFYVCWAADVKLNATTRQLSFFKGHIIGISSLALKPHPYHVQITNFLLVKPSHAHISVKSGNFLMSLISQYCSNFYSFQLITQAIIYLIFLYFYWKNKYEDFNSGWGSFFAYIMNYDSILFQFSHLQQTD